jgi:hypothetical protein
MKKSDLTSQEVRWLLAKQGISVRPAYVTDNYVFTSISLPHPLKRKLDRLQRREKLTRSRIVQMLLERVNEDNLLATLEAMENV